MEVHISHGVQISVESRFLKSHSNVAQHHFAHAYRITIDNLNEYPVQLLSRHWMIFDSSGPAREVKGEGVIGEQPVIQGGASFSYESWSPVHSPVGAMKGKYFMIRIDTNESFDVEIPQFSLVADFKLN